LFQVYIERLI